MPCDHVEKQRRFTPSIWCNLREQRMNGTDSHLNITCYFMTRTSLTYRLKEIAAEEPTDVVVATAPKPVVQLAQLVLAGVLPPQVLADVYAELSAAYQEVNTQFRCSHDSLVDIGFLTRLEQEKLTFPAMEVFVHEVDPGQTGTVLFQDYIRFATSIVAEKLAYENIAVHPVCKTLTPFLQFNDVWHLLTSCCV